MAPLYKYFLLPRTALILFALYFLSMVSAFAQNDVFTIDGVTVDVTAENAIKAREMAFQEAQIKAFEELTTRMLPENEVAGFKKADPLTISSMIKDYEVSDEKLSSKRYIGTYKIRFNDRDVRRHFSGAGASFTDVASAQMLILPFLDTGSGMILWSPQNQWMRAWSRAPALASGLVPLTVPLGDLQDVSDIGDDEALTYSRRALQSITDRYGAKEAVIAIARPEGTGLSVQLYRTDRARPEYVHQILERAIPGQSEAELYARAVQSVRAALRKDWKQKTVVDTRQQGQVSIRVRYASLQEWSNIQRSLNRTSGVTNVALQALSPREAYLKLTFDGTLERLKVALEQKRLYLSKPNIQPTNTRGLNTDYSQGLLGRAGLGRKVQDEKVIYDLMTRKISTGVAYNPGLQPTPVPKIQPAPHAPTSQSNQTHYQNQF